MQWRCPCSCSASRVVIQQQASNEPVTGSAVSLTAAQPETFKLVVPIQFSAWACVETVSLTGELVGVYHTNTTGQGTHGKQLFLQRLTGYGMSTGYRYQAIGISNAVGMQPQNGATPYTEVASFILVSRAALLKMRLLMHSTLDANGNLTAVTFDASVACQ